MKIILILLGIGLTFAFIFPTMLDAIFEDQTLKTVLLYVGVIILLGCLGGVADWLEERSHSQDDIKT
jgi:ABC-type transport system involved in cytochrome bd biosynthesis fused ATPase/permease subunit